MSITLTTRNAGLDDMVALLRDHRARSMDVIASATALIAEGASIRIHGMQPLVTRAAEITEDGVSPEVTVDPNGLYAVTETAEAGVSEKLGIERGYLRRLRDQRPRLWDANVNDWLHGDAAKPEAEREYPADSRSFLLRTLRGDNGEAGVVRALLSERYQIIDNFDILMAALEGIDQAGMAGKVEIDGCDLTESKMFVRVACPAIAALAPKLLEGYRNPFAEDKGVPRGGGWTVPQALRVAEREGQGYAPGTEPIVFAGFVISNSEVGKGAFSLTPRLIMRVCKNGLTLPLLKIKDIHLGGKNDDGVVAMSQNTMAKTLALVTARTTDAVARFLSEEFLAEQIAEVTRKAETPVANPVATITAAVKASGIPNKHVDSILAKFTAGGQLTAGGVMQAVTAQAQDEVDAELAAMMEDEALVILDQAHRHALANA